MLNDKIAIIFGGSGSIGSAVAKQLAADGAEVFVSGRTGAAVEAVVKQIKQAGGRAHAAQVDAEDETEVAEFVGRVVKEAGSVDIVFNAIGPKASDYGNGKLAVDLGVDEYLLPLTSLVKSQFITARAAAQAMVAQKSGVIIFLTGSPARGHVPGATAIGTAFGAIETFMENLAFELSPSGVRAVCLRTTANTDSRTIRESIKLIAQQMGASEEDVRQKIASYNFLKTPAKVADTANAIAFIASDRARLITATVVNSSAGAALD